MLQLIVLGVLALPVILYLVPAVIMDSKKILGSLRRMKYQYEVTFALNMLTPNERFFFQSIMFLGLSLVVIATTLYLPERLQYIYGRALYYFYGSPFYLSASSAASSISKQGLRSTIQDAFQQSNSSLSDKLVAYGAGVKTAFANNGLTLEDISNYMSGIVGYATLSPPAAIKDEPVHAEAPSVESRVPVLEPEL